jgi:hypothetical protein
MTTLAPSRPAVQTKPSAIAPQTTRSAVRPAMPAARLSFLLTLLRALGAPAC